MRRMSLWAVLLGLLAGAAFGQASRRSPEFVVKMLNGSQQLLSQYQGKIVVVTFLSTT